MSTSDKELKEIAQQEYKHGFITDIEADSAPKGLSEDIVRFISQKLLLVQDQLHPDYSSWVSFSVKNSK